MKQYLLSVYQPAGPIPEPEVMQQISRDLEALNAEIKAAGSWVFAGGLFPPSTATVVRVRDGDVLTTDGPFAEGEGAPRRIHHRPRTDLDAALDWAGKMARATTLPVEVRPFQDGGER